MQLNFKKLFSIFEIIALEPVAGISLLYDENTCDRQSPFFQTVLGFRIWLREMLSNSICPRLLENSDKSAALHVSAVFGNREHVDSGRVFWNKSFRALK